ncbi:MAG: B12-binding domain-containing radical SAM protein [Acidobacteriota bacterium]
MALSVLLVLPIREGNNYQISPDLGILYLGTVLQNHGFDVTLLDCPKEHFTFTDFKRFIQEKHFDAVGFRCYSRDHNYVNHHLNIVRQVNPQALTLVGGPHPSALGEFVLSSMPNLNFAWKAEAEEGFPQLLSLFEEYGQAIPEQQLQTIPGLVWKSKAEDRIITNAPSFGLDLDSYGIPAWELLRPETYPGFIWDDYYPILTTRGCPYPCTYCNTPGLSGKKLRHRTVDHVLEELRLLKSRYNIERFCIIDDEFTLSKKYAKSFCQGLIDSGLNLKWDCPVGVRLDSLNPELLEIMEAAGCEALAVGIESGNDRIQELIQKRVTVDRIREKAEMIGHCSRIKVTGYFMIGFLDETEEEIWDTIKLACSLPLVRANFNIVIPIPGTAIFDEAVQQDKLKVQNINWDDCTSDQIAFQRNHVSGKRLIKLQRQAYLRFYGRPQIIWQMGRDSLRNPEVIRASLRKLKMLFARGETQRFEPLYLKEAAV